VLLDSLTYTPERKRERSHRTQGLAAAISSARGWRRSLIACAAGAASALAHAPLHLWPILFVTLPVLVWLIDGAPQTASSAHSALGRHWQKLKASAGIGWWFGFGYFLVGLYWISNALLVDIKTFGWLLPIAVPAVPAGLAVFLAFGVALAGMLWTRGAMRIVALAIALTVAEWVRGHVFSGFPWNALGYALTSPLELAQSASVFGLWGLTFLVVLICASPAALIDARSDTPRPWLIVLAAAGALLGLAAFGAARLSQTPTAFVDAVELRIMQPNLPQDEKFNYSTKAQVLNHYAKLSAMPSTAHPGGLAEITHLIWPESAFPFYLNQEANALSEIGELLPQGTTLITGGDRITEPQASTPRIYNSIYVIDHHAAVLAVYDKLHLVPFGEYLPLQPLLERFGIVQLTKIEGGFATGAARTMLAVPGAPPMLPLICYEVIFPGEAVPAGERPAWLLNVTNDGWFGNSSGPYQHLQQARVRAIEEGLPLVRAANTGISAVIDPVGRLIASLPLGSEGVLDARLPQPLAPTLYARFGDRTPAVLLAIAFGCLIARLRRTDGGQTTDDGGKMAEERTKD
jgi:apolipoprotein N-acyltransferase